MEHLSDVQRAMRNAEDAISHSLEEVKKVNSAIDVLLQREQAAEDASLRAVEEGAQVSEAQLGQMERAMNAVAASVAQVAQSVGGGVQHEGQSGGHDPTALPKPFA